MALPEAARHRDLHRAVRVRRRPGAERDPQARVHRLQRQRLPVPAARRQPGLCLQRLQRRQCGPGQEVLVPAVHDGLAGRPDRRGEPDRQPGQERGRDRLHHRLRQEHRLHRHRHRLRELLVLGRQRPGELLHLPHQPGDRRPRGRDEAPGRGPARRHHRLQLRHGAGRRRRPGGHDGLRRRVPVAGRQHLSRLHPLRLGTVPDHRRTGADPGERAQPLRGGPADRGVRGDGPVPEHHRQPDHRRHAERARLLQRPGRHRLPA